MHTTEKIPDEESVLVFSDLHLGGADDRETAGRFCRLLDHLLSGHREVCHGNPDAQTGPTTMRPPAKVILLGDILELWDPRGQDRHCALLDALVPFLKLRELRCSIVYVTGNHDEDVGEMVDSVIDGNPTGSPLWRQAFRVFYGCENGKKVAESLKIAWNGTYRVQMDYEKHLVSNTEDILEISPRHYPAATTGGDVMGLEAGGIHYVFFHGQQFDDEQVTHTLSRAIGRRIDPVDAMEDLVCCSFTRTIPSTGRAVISLAAFGACVIGLAPAPVEARLVTGAATAVALAAISVAGIWLFGLSTRARAGLLPPTSLHFLGLSSVSLAIIVGGIVYGWQLLGAGVLEWIFPIGLIFGLFWTFTVSVPGLVAGVKKPLYRLISSKDRSTEGIYRNAVRGRLYRYRAEVLVFGHTHVAESFPADRAGLRDTRNRDDDKPVLMINTGSWVSEGEQTDVFVYIDCDGVGSMRWDDEGRRVVCTTHFPSSDILASREAIRSH
ncbi:MAG: hypothetical protein AB7S61_01395 [Methanoregulaceae archaeon]